jgi:hypothetical protein
MAFILKLVKSAYSTDVNERETQTNTSMLIYTTKRLKELKELNLNSP